MVGAGKSTFARHIEERLLAAGLDVERAAFRRRARRAPTDEAAPAASEDAQPKTRAVRWQGFKLRRLNAMTAAGYAGRIMWYRIQQLRRQPSSRVLDRYFYDSFVHYRLSSRRERFYVRVLRRVIPPPDLAVLLLAAPDVIVARRPGYALEYVELVADNYERLSAFFPELVAVRTDGAEPALQQATALIDNWLGESGAAAARTATQMRESRVAGGR
jgi:thymidylate kinase